MNQYTQQIQAIKETFDHMNNAFHDISKAIEENTISVTSVASDTTNLANQINCIQHDINSCQESASVLESETKTFILN